MDSDALLVRRARRGDRVAFETLYRSHIGRVHALCSRIAGDRAAGEDLSQESFLLAWRKLADFRGDSAFGTWLYRIATNVALGYLRKRPEWHAHGDSDELEAELPRHPGPGPQGIDLERAIAALPPRARGVLVLHDIEGFDHKEIGMLMGIAEGTSKAQLHRARQTLIGRLG